MKVFSLSILFVLFSSSVCAQPANPTNVDNLERTIVFVGIVHNNKVIRSGLGKIHIVQIGDSIGLGAGPSGNLGSPIDYYVGENYDPGEITYVNLSIGGWRTFQVAEIFDAAVQLSPDVIFMHVGINDITYLRTFEQAENDIELMRLKAQLAGIPIKISEVLPWRDDGLLDTRIANWNASLGAYCAEKDGVDLLICHDAMEDPLNDDRPHPDWIQSDHRHWNDTGNANLAALWFAQFVYLPE